MSTSLAPRSLRLAVLCSAVALPLGACTMQSDSSGASSSATEAPIPASEREARFQPADQIVATEKAPEAEPARADGAKAPSAPAPPSGAGGETRNGISALLSQIDGVQVGGAAGGVSSNSLDSIRRKAGGKRKLARAKREVSSPKGTTGIGRIGTVGRGSGGASYGVGGLGLRGSASGGGGVALAPAPKPTSRRPMEKDREVSADPQEGGTFVHAGTNPWTVTEDDRLSTFAIDVDTGSFFYARRFLERGRAPTASSVRVEEWVNAFHYDYKGPSGRVPFAVHTEVAPSPITDGRHLMRVGIQGKHVSNRDRKPANLTFLVDVSGSMSRPDKLPLAQRALHHLVDQLDGRDSVGIVTYAGRTGVVLEQTSARDKQTIHRAIDAMRSSGGTNMDSGMQLAYRNANKHLSSGSVSRVIVLSDGDANIGRTSHNEMLGKIKGYVSEGIKMSTVGFGTGNYRDHLMEQLADAGDGNYSYIDSMRTAEKVFGQDLAGTLEVIAKDVKIQVEMDPSVVKSYRLLGYENRDVADRDFRNDKVDAGEIGAGHSVTALYEVELKGPSPSAFSLAELATVRVRWKAPKGARADEVAHAVNARDVHDRFGDLSADTRFATAMALASEVLRGSPHAAHLSVDDARQIAADAATGRFADERRELVSLLEKVAQRAQVARR